MLESIAREAGPKGVHVAYVAIDAVIDLAWTREAFPNKPDDFFCQPADIANEVMHRRAATQRMVFNRSFDPTERCGSYER